MAHDIEWLLSIAADSQELTTPDDELTELINTV